jgi:predicted phosphodiesterase
MSEFTSVPPPPISQPVIDPSTSDRHSPLSSIRDDGLIIVCISDTHSKHHQIQNLPLGDILIHAGDYSSTGTLQETKSFIKWFDSLSSYSSKIFIAGNHDTTIDTAYYCNRGAARFHRQSKKMTPNEIESYSKECRELLITSSQSKYLEDSEHMIHYQPNNNNDDSPLHSFKVYGSPWQPEFCDWAFNLDRGPEIRKYWEMIPHDTDILITHGPPLGFGDLTADGFRCGCSDLLDIVLEHPPRVHIFGHIHEAYGKLSPFILLTILTLTRIMVE